MTNETQIIVIDDNLKQNAPLIVSLSDKYNPSNVKLFNRSKEGLDYIMNNLTQKLIVILDWELGEGEIQGIDIFETIREKTSLVYIIFSTVRKIDEIPYEQLKKMINNDAMGIVEKLDGYKKTLEFVDKAAHQLDSRLDAVLEQWVNRHSEDERIKPFIASRSGQVYNLNDLLKAIREKTDVGKDMERKMIYLTIDLLARGKEKIDD